MPPGMARAPQGKAHMPTKMDPCSCGGRTRRRGWAGPGSSRAEDRKGWGAGGCTRRARPSWAEDRGGGRGERTGAGDGGAHARRARRRSPSGACARWPWPALAQWSPHSAGSSLFADEREELEKENGSVSNNTMSGRWVIFFKVSHLHSH